MAELRSLTIKTGTVKRVQRELTMYRKEVEQEYEKVQKLKDGDADSHDVKYAVRW